VQYAIALTLVLTSDELDCIVARVMRENDRNTAVFRKCYHDRVLEPRDCGVALSLQTHGLLFHFTTSMGLFFYFELAALIYLSPSAQFIFLPLHLKKKDKHWTSIASSAKKNRPIAARRHSKLWIRNVIARGRT